MLIDISAFRPGRRGVIRQFGGVDCRKAAVAVWAYCRMPSHVHPIMAPQSANGLARAVGETAQQLEIGKIGKVSP